MIIDTNFWKKECVCEISDGKVLDIILDFVSEIKPEEVEKYLDMTLRDCVREEVHNIWIQYYMQDFQHLIDCRYQREETESESSEELRARDAEQ